MRIIRTFFQSKGAVDVSSECLKIAVRYRELHSEYRFKIIFGIPFGPLLFVVYKLRNRVGIQEATISMVGKVGNVKVVLKRWSGSVVQSDR